MARYEEDDDRPRKSKVGKKKKQSSGPSIGKILSIGFSILVFLGLVARGVGRIMRAVDKNRPPAAVQAPVGDAPGDSLPEEQWGIKSSQKAGSKNNLKQIGLALHYYHETFGMFPAASITRHDKTVCVSWQSSLLAYTDQHLLYDRIDFNNAWTSPQNQYSFGQPVPIYLNPLYKDTGRSISHYAGNSQFFQSDRWLKITDISDGLATTIMVGEVSAGLKPWADPTNVRDPALGLGKTPEQFGGTFQEGSHFLMADGEVKFVSDNIDLQVMKALATPNGGEVVHDF